MTSDTEASIRAMSCFAKEIPNMNDNALRASVKWVLDYSNAELDRRRGVSLWPFPERTEPQHGEGEKK